MKKIIQTSSIQINELFSSEERDKLSSSVNNITEKALIIKNMTEGAIIYLDYDGDSTISDGYPIDYQDSISFSKSNLSKVQICSDTPDTEIRILFI